jgi:hypothetical protein
MLAAPPPPLPFPDLARLGRNNWWRYLLGVLVITFSWLGFTFVLVAALVIAVTFDGNPATGVNGVTGELVGVSALAMFNVTMLSFLGLFVALFLVVRLIHRRPFISLITPRPRFDLPRAALGFGVYALLAAAASLVEALLYPGRYTFTWTPAALLGFLPGIFILLPIQAASEELLLRGYALQGFNLLLKRPWLSALLSSLIFMLLHTANPEMGAGPLLMALNYFVMGLFLALVTLKDNRLELAIGIHVANNMFSALFTNYVNSAAPTPSLFTVNTLDTVYSLISFLVIGALFYALFFLRRKPLSQASGEAPETS